MHKVVFPSTRAKSSENQEEDHDLRDRVELVERREGTLLGFSISHFNGRGWEAVLGQGCLHLWQDQKNENQECDDLIDIMVDLRKQ
jgi:hypothetical protein